MELIIEKNKIEKQYWKDLWRYRDLFFMLSWRDITVRYKQTVIGILWAVLRPFLTMIAFTFVFGKVAKLDSTGVPYALLVFVAMLPWQLFSSAITSAGDSLIGNSNLISKIYFPRLLVPASSIAVSVIDFFISLIILFFMMVWYSYIPSLNILFIIPLTFLAAFIALGPGLFLCSINVKYRDFRYALPFITQFGIYVSPVGFSSSIVPEKWRLLYELNPLVGVIDGFRWAVLNNIEFPLRSLIFSIIFCVIFLIIGIKKFRSSEKSFVDVI